MSPDPFPRIGLLFLSKIPNESNDTLLSYAFVDFRSCSIFSAIDKLADMNVAEIKKYTF